MEARLIPRKVAPGAYEALSELQSYVNHCGLEQSFVELVKLRASQINNCAWCIDRHTKDALAAGETERRLFLLAAWRECPFYTPRARAALAWTEALTSIAGDTVSDAVVEVTKVEFSELELVNLNMAVIAINCWNRMNVAFRVPPGDDKPVSP
ncbi:MAG: carboxymuconolactone decarboxylase family protein [Devosia sp.]